MSKTPIAVQLNSVTKDFKKTQAQKTLKSKFINLFKKTEVQKFKVLENISLDINQGEFFGIVGKNGGGKSTLLKLIAEIYKPTKGKVVVAGKLVPFIELGVGFNPELSGRENVYLNGALLGFDSKEVEGFYDEIVEFAELEGFMEEKLKNFSSGMQVRLAFAVAIKAKADILLIDEVLAVGDLKFQRKCFEYFKSLKRSGTTVVFVTHDMEAVREYCDRAALIKDGRVAVVGTADKVAQEYTKILSAKSSVSKNNKSRESWGDFRATMSEPRVEINASKIRFTIKIDPQEELDGVVCGIRLRDENNNYLFGGSTKSLGVKSPKLKQQQKVDINWSFDNILSTGDYSLDVAIHHLDGKSVHEWWDDAIQFRIEKDQKNIYPIDPEFKVGFKRTT